MADNIHHRAEAQFVLFHETLGHAGLRGLLGAALNPILRQIALRNRHIAHAAAQWRNDNHDVRKMQNLSEEDYFLRSLEEALVDVAGKGQDIKGLQKLSLFAQTKLREYGLHAVADWLENRSNAELLHLLTSARDHILLAPEEDVGHQAQTEQAQTDEDAALFSRAGLQRIEHANRARDAAWAGDEHGKTSRGGTSNHISALARDSFGGFVVETGAKADVLADKHTLPKLESGVNIAQYLAEKFFDNGKIPSIAKGNFNKWFNKLTSEEFDQIWSIKKFRKIIERRIRKPGTLHEWLLVAHADIFKKWGISMDEIKEMRTPIKDIKGVNPTWIHGGIGSTTAHNEIIALIESSNSFLEYKSKLQIWADRRLKGGRKDLPINLRN